MQPFPILTGRQAPPVVSPYSTEANAAFAAMTVKPDDTRKTIYDTMIRALKTHGIWSKLDLLYLCCAHDEQASRINLITPGTYTATVIGAPTFTVNEGWAGVSTTNKLTTGFNPSSAAGRKLSQNSCSIHAYLKTNSTTAQRVVGNVGFSVTARTSSKGSLECASSGGVNYAGATTDYQGFFQARRTDSANVAAWLNLGSSGASSAIASVALANTELNICGGGSNSTTNASVHQVRLFAVGQGLTDQEISDTYTDINAFITGVGANLTTGL